MRRDEFIAAYEHVRQALESSGIMGAAGAVGRPGGQKAGDIGPEVLSAYARFVSLSERFGPTERQFLSHMKLDGLLSARFWSAAIAGADVRGDAVTLRQQIRLFVESLPGLIALLRRQADETEVLIRESDQKKKSTKEIRTHKITFLIRETESPSLTVKQFAVIIETIEALYIAISRIETIEIHDLIVGNLDSGSDKSIDVFGVAQGIDKLSGILLQVWDRIRYRKANQMSTSVKTAAEGLDLLNKLKESASTGAVTPEEAEKLRRTVINGIDSLFKNGVVTTEIVNQPPITIDQIPIERRKLLTHYAGPTEAESRSDAERIAQEDEDE